MKLLLPYPKSFESSCNYNLEEPLPVWVVGCLKNRKKNKFINIFDKDLEFIEVDKATVIALNEFALNIIAKEAIIEMLMIPSSDIDISSFITYTPLIPILKKNNIKTLSDIAEIGLKKILTFQDIGINKVIYLAQSICAIEENFLDEIEVDEIDQEGNKKLINNLIEDSFEIDSLFLNDPRFYQVKLSVINIVDFDNLDEKPSWFEVLNHLSNLIPEERIKEIILMLSYQINEIKNQSLEDQMKNVFMASIKMMKSNSFRDKRLANFENLTNRLGISESEEKIYTLEKTAQTLNPPVTRERIRQIESQTLKMLNFQPSEELIFIPKLFEVRKIFNENLLLSTEELSKKIQLCGYGKWNIERLISCFNLFNIPNSFEVQKNIINVSKNKKATHYVIQIAEKIIRYNGMVEKKHLASIVQKDIEIDELSIEKILNNISHRVFEGWFYKESSSNQLISIAQRIANFSNEFSISDLREGFIKHKALREPSFFSDKKRSGFYGFRIPPSKAIEILFNSNMIKDFEVRDKKIICSRLNNKYIEDLESADNIFLQYFKARDFECATHQEMANYFIKGKLISEASFRIYLSYKPYFKNYGRGIWGIAGKPPSSLLVENAKNRLEKKVKAKIEWCEEGVLSIKTSLNNVTSFVFAVDQDYQNLMRKDYFDIFHEGEKYTTIKRSSGFWYGAGKYLSNILFCELGDFIDIRLDMNKNRAKISIIDEISYFE